MDLAGCEIGRSGLFVYLVDLVSFVQPNKRDKPNKQMTVFLRWQTVSASC
jgi:hypothetical protein